ncbi:hypothetical protein [Empedobacter falsenii]|uniref:Uncharacterized protein n=1 Tax=Empedobacter falsenii TaxID=343874 RepID=A0A376GFX4_9FLAO|nr:hypothetical protein [Empedobacter falsenii]STD59304.1 Uncharacterised protein [Empedobacter falsenii]
MNELVGIKNINSIESINQIKKELLIFDKIFIVGLQEWKEVFEQKLFEDTHSFLEKKGLVSLNDFVIYQGYLAMNNEVKKIGGWDKYYESHKTDDLVFKNENLEYLVDEGKIIFKYDKLTKGNQYAEIHNQISPIIESRLNSKSQSLKEFFDLCNFCHDLKTRIITTSYNNSKYTVIPCDNSIYSIENITNIKAETYNLILEDFPIIDVQGLSWEQIFDFKKDTEVCNSIWGLRNWISNISKSNKNINEIEEEYRYLKHKYENSIKLHKLKTSNSLFQTTIQTSAELIENIAKLKFRKITDLFFKFNENRISLMEAELKSEGNQLSYLFKINNKFN